MWLIFQDETRVMLNCKDAIIRLTPRPAARSVTPVTPKSLYEAIRKKHMVITQHVEQEPTQDPRRTESLSDLLIATPCGSCMIKFKWKDQLEKFYAVLRDALVGSRVSLEVGQSEMEYESIKIFNFKMTGRVIVDGTVSVEAKESLTCHFDEDSIRVVTEDGPLHVKLLDNPL